MLNIIDTSIAIQSKQTGRFLLHRKDVQWYFALFDSMANFSPLADMIEKMKLILGDPYADDATFTYINTKQSNFHLYHVWVNDEPLSRHCALPYEWRSLYDFPAGLHYSVDQAFDSPHFMESILRPI